MSNYPTKGSLLGNATTDGLSSNNYFTKEYIIDRPIIEVWNGSWGLTDLSAADSVGTADQVEVNSSLQLAVDFDNAETFGFNFRIPEDCDVSKEMNLRFLWSNSAATNAANTLLLTPLYTHWVPGTTAVAVPATAFSSVAAAQASFGANVQGYTGWSTLASGISTAVGGESRLAIKVTATLATITDATVFAAEFRYYRRFIGA
jgi:hypothetical protein